MGNKSDITEQCASWYQTLTGQAALYSTKELCTKTMSEIFGYYAIQIGMLSKECDFLKDSRINASYSLASPENLLELKVLREIDRVLVPEGHCILIGLNPYSLSNINRSVIPNLKKKQETYKMRSAARVKDWFSLLGFEVLDINYTGFRPALNNQRIFNSLKWIDRLGEYAGPMLGSMYIVHAKKQVVAMRPNKKVWRFLKYE